MTDPIRPARPDEPAPCADKVNPWIDSTPWHPRLHPHNAVARFYKNTVWSTRDIPVSGDPPAGFIAITSDNYVTACYTRPSGKGTGTALMRAAQNQRYMLLLWTHVPNFPAQSFYAKMGFSEVRRTNGDNEEGVPDILYQWTSA